MTASIGSLGSSAPARTLTTDAGAPIVLPSLVRGGGAGFARSTAKAIGSVMSKTMGVALERSATWNQ